MFVGCLCKSCVSVYVCESRSSPPPSPLSKSMSLVLNNASISRRHLKRQSFNYILLWKVLLSLCECLNQVVSALGSFLSSLNRVFIACLELEMSVTTTKEEEKWRKMTTRDVFQILDERNGSKIPQPSSMSSPSSLILLFWIPLLSSSISIASHAQVSGITLLNLIPKECVSLHKSLFFSRKIVLQNLQWECIWEIMNLSLSLFLQFLSQSLQKKMVRSFWLFYWSGKSLSEERLLSHTYFPKFSVCEE